ncbi:MAG: GxxExxY protein [Bacteroidetes bacterium]|nr:GxxExxY protein [Bacteroidota bacterium]
MLEMEKLLFAELSYNIMGACFDVQKQLGGGHLERVYHNALKESLNNRAIRFKDEVKTLVFYNEKNDGVWICRFCCRKHHCPRDKT